MSDDLFRDSFGTRPAPTRSRWTIALSVVALSVVAVSGWVWARSHPITHSAWRSPRSAASSICMASNPGSDGTAAPQTASNRARAASIGAKPVSLDGSQPMWAEP